MGTTESRDGGKGFGRGEREGWEVRDPERGDKREKARGCMIIQQQCLIFCSPKGLWEGSQEKRGGSRKVPPSKISS